MSSDEYQVQNEYRYSRKSFRKNGRRVSLDNEAVTINDTNVEAAVHYSRNDVVVDAPRCSCDQENDGDVANILHKKCPVITLAQQQLQLLLDETDRLLCDSDNSQCCRSVYDFLCMCKDVLKVQNKSLCFFLILLVMSFITGVLFGALSCGVNLRKFNSPIITCLDNFFISEKYYNRKDYRGIV